MSQQMSPDSKWVFVEETIPDNTPFKGGTAFHKRWRLRNTGPVTWDSGYKIKFLAGDMMSGPEEIRLAHDVVANQEVDITFLLTTPEAPGTYRADWQLVDAEGRFVQSVPDGGNFYLIVESTGTGDVKVQAPVAPATPGERVLNPATLPSWMLGVNMRDFAYFDIRGINEAKNIVAYQKQHAQKLQEIGVKSVRFYGNHMHFDPNQCIDRIGTALDVLKAHGMRGVVSLNDALGHSQMFVKGDEKYHSEPPEGYLHKNYFNEGWYKENYLPHIEKVTKAFATSDAVLVWEIGNEYVTIPVGATDADLEGFYQFTKAASETIARNTQHRISLGLLNSHQVSQRDDVGVANYARKLYGLPFIDLITVHYYNQDGERPWAVLDTKIAKELGKPYYIGEMGSSHDFGDRVPFYRNELDFWRKDGSFMVMPWGYSLNNQPYLDNRSIIGQHHGDFNQVVDAIRQFA